jgi:hypothetical protein
VTKRPKSPKRFYRCARCHSPVPSSYNACGSCGYNAYKVGELVDKALAMFPGSRELR